MKKLLLLMSIFMLSSCSSKTNVVVREFVGHNVSEVYEWCATLDDAYSCEISYEDAEGFEKDIVFEQSLKAGKKVKEDVFFKVASGNEKDVVMPYITPEVTASDISVWAEAAGMENVQFVYETSDTVEKNHVIRIEPYVNVKKSTPITVTVSSGPAEPASTEFEIRYGDYLGLTVAEFEAKAKGLGLNPNHQTSRDKHDSNIRIGNIVWHGSGTYEKGENFNYGVCINAITINPSQYFGISEDDFIKTAKSLKLNPRHLENRDAYSSSVSKGYIVTHGNGVYVEGEDFNYGLSRGPAKVESGYEGALEDNLLAYLNSLELNGSRSTSSSSTVSSGRIISYNYGRYSSGDTVKYVVSTGPEDTSVNVPDFEGKSESDLLNFLSANGLYVGSRSEAESVYAKGTIISNDSGKKNKGDRISYVVASESSGKAIIEAFDTIYEQVSHPGDYEHAAFDMHRYLFGRGFMNYDIVQATFGSYEPGILLAIEIDGEQLTYAQDVPLDAHIVCYISNYVE